MNEKKENALVPKPPSAVEKAAPGTKRILSGMASDTLALAKQRAPAKFRIGDYEWCEPDYKQILIWAEHTGLKPEEVIARLFDYQSLCENLRSGEPRSIPGWEPDEEPFQIFEEPLFADGKLLKVNFDLRLLRCNNLLWVNGLEITHLRFVGASEQAWLSDLGSLPLDQLRWLDCGWLGLIHLNLSSVPHLEYLDCEPNNLEELRLGSLPKLTHLNCSDNKITDLKLDQIPNLRFLNCEANCLHELNLAEVPELKSLHCSNNQIFKLGLSKCSEILRLECFRNRLTQLDLSSCQGLKWLDCADNAISELDLSSCPNLEEVDCSGNPISVLNIRGLKHLRKLNCSFHTEVIMYTDQVHTVQDPEVQFRMGVSYYCGHRVPRNHTEAAKLFRFAAERGHIHAQACLAECYFEGNGVPQDYSKAVEWYQKAAVQGNPEAQANLSRAQANLGLAYLYGKGVSKDKSEAYKWFKSAAEQGDKEVTEKLTSLVSTLSSNELKEVGVFFPLKRRAAIKVGETVIVGSKLPTETSGRDGKN
jgi:hypothetical protein